MHTKEQAERAVRSALIDAVNEDGRDSPAGNELRSRLMREAKKVSLDEIIARMEDLDVLPMTDALQIELEVLEERKRALLASSPDNTSSSFIVALLRESAQTATEQQIEALNHLCGGAEQRAVQLSVVAVCDEVAAMLVTKNRAYGNSALNPKRVFSRADAMEQIKVRIDDKLSRMSTGRALPDESLRDTTFDLMGYLVLLIVAERAKAAT